MANEMIEERVGGVFYFFGGKKLMNPFSPSAVIACFLFTELFISFTRPFTHEMINLAIFFICQK